MEFIIALLIFGTTSIETVLEDNQQENQVITQEVTIPIKESLFLSMERSPCFGKCPNYKISIFNTGRVIYEGFNFVEKEGKYETQLSEDAMNEIKEQMELIKIFKMEDKYDSPITDIPSTLIYINNDGKKKKIYDRHGAPNELREFEKLIDHFVLKSELTKIGEKE